MIKSMTNIDKIRKPILLVIEGDSFREGDEEDYNAFYYGDPCEVWGYIDELYSESGTVGYIVGDK